MVSLCFEGGEGGRGVVDCGSFERPREMYRFGSTNWCFFVFLCFVVFSFVFLFFIAHDHCFVHAALPVDEHSTTRFLCM